MIRIDEDRLHTAVVRLYSRRSRRPVTVREIRCEGGTSYNTIYSRYGSIDELYRAAVTARARRISSQIADWTCDNASLREALTAYARFVTDLFDSPQYRDLLFLVTVDSEDYPWLPVVHRKLVYAPLVARVSAVTRDAGRRMSLDLVLAPAEQQAFIDNLQVCALAHHAVPGQPERALDGESRIRSAVDRAVNAARADEAANNGLRWFIRGLSQSPSSRPG